MPFEAAASVLMLPLRFSDKLKDLRFSKELEDFREPVDLHKPAELPRARWDDGLFAVVSPV